MNASLTCATSAAWKRRFASVAFCALTSRNTTLWAGLPSHCVWMASASTSRVSTIKGHDHHFQRRARIPVMLPRSDLSAHRGARIRVDEIGDLATEQLASRLCSHLAHQRLVDVDVAAVGMNTDGDRAVIEQPAVLLIGLNVLGLLSKSERLYALDTFQGDYLPPRSSRRGLSDFPRIGTAGPGVHAAQFAPKTKYSSELNIPQLFLSLDSSAGLRHAEWTNRMWHSGYR